MCLEQITTQMVSCIVPRQQYCLQNPMFLWRITLFSFVAIFRFFPSCYWKKQFYHGCIGVFGNDIHDNVKRIFFSKLLDEVDCRQIMFLPQWLLYSMLIWILPHEQNVSSKEIYTMVNMSKQVPQLKLLGTRLHRRKNSKHIVPCVITQRYCRS